MGLVTPKEVSKTIGIDKLGGLGTVLSGSLMNLLKISKLNKIYNKNKHLPDEVFLDALVKDFKIKFEIDPEELKRLPKTGAYITISNHPLGGIDGILLLKIMLKNNPNYKIIANFLLHRIEPMKKYIMPVNPFENRKEAQSSIKGIKQALAHLKEGKPLGIFPAGEVSNRKEDKRYVDKPWEEGAIKLIKKAEVPVVPIYFSARNSKLFYLLSKISPTLQTAKLPSELLSQKDKVIRIKIGKPISVAEQKEYTDMAEYSNFLRKKTYLLANMFQEEKKTFKKNIKKSPSPHFITEEIVSPADKNAVREEIEKLRGQNSRLFQSKNYEVFLTEAQHIPNILHEIGRLREVTFRQVGEGTNKAQDLDKYDEHYHHLFLWDNDTEQIAGAYRMGLGKFIFEKKGKNGFYLQELFKFESNLDEMLEHSIEMGRAFIIKEYQLKPTPLFLLWKGIVHLTFRYPEHKYLIGGVSISNEFSDFSKSLMVEFMKSYYHDPAVAQYITPKQEYFPKLKEADRNFVFDIAKDDLNKLDKIIEEVERNNLRLPVLIKKYIKQNAKVLCFNIDPMFNNAIDGLMYIKIENLPESTVKPIMEEIENEKHNNPA